MRDDGGKEGGRLGGRESKAREAGVTGGWFCGWLGDLHALCSAVNGGCVAPTANGSKLGERKRKGEDARCRLDGERNGEKATKCEG